MSGQISSRDVGVVRNNPSKFDINFELNLLSVCVLTGIAGTFFGHPIDTVKVRQQTHPHGQLSTRHCVQLALKNEGVS